MTTEKTLKLKNHNGTFELKQSRFLKWGIISAALAQQAINQSKAEITKVAGNYDVDLLGDTFRGYEIVAKSKEGRWIDGRGKTPRAAMRDCHYLRTIFDN
jgi:lipopolysaccharide export system protein LptA